MTSTALTIDRNYLRMLSDVEIVRLGYESGHELAVALAERLEQLDGLIDLVDAARKEADDADARADSWRKEANHLQALLDSRS